VTASPYTGDGGTCRLCRAYCDWVVDPTACVDRACPNLYAFDDPSGRRVVGCLERVFAAEIDLDAFTRIRDAHGGRFGVLRATRRPLPVCAAGVERAYPRRLGPAGCINPEFAEPHDRPAFTVTAAGSPPAP
jgi:hypothetical protein